MIHGVRMMETELMLSWEGDDIQALLKVVQKLLKENQSLKQRLQDSLSNTDHSPDIVNFHGAFCGNVDGQLTGEAPTRNVMPVPPDIKCLHVPNLMAPLRNPPFRRKTNIDNNYEVVAESAPCRFCGISHVLGIQFCPAHSRSCFNCGKLHHFARMCWHRREKSVPKAMTKTVHLFGNDDYKHSSSRREEKTEANKTNYVKEAVEGNCNKNDYAETKDEETASMEEVEQGKVIQDNSLEVRDENAESLLLEQEIKPAENQRLSKSQKRKVRRTRKAKQVIDDSKNERNTDGKDLDDACCEVCGKEASLECPRCRWICYCSSEHQEQDRTSHQPLCKKLSPVGFRIVDDAVEGKCCEKVEEDNIDEKFNDKLFEKIALDMGLYDDDTDEGVEDEIESLEKEKIKEPVV